MGKKSITAVMTALVAGAFLLAGCGGSDSGSGEQTKAQTETVEKSTEQSKPTEQPAETSKPAEQSTSTRSVEPADQKPESSDRPEPTEEVSPLLNFRSPEMNQKAPDVYKVNLETTKGDIVIQVKRTWAPLGADRFYNLVRNGYYDECRFFRVLPTFMAQIGIHGDPRVSSVWRAARIKDDIVKKSNTRGRLSYATAGPDSRTTQFFINYKDNSGSLDRQGFSPFGEVIEGMDVVDDLHSGYGECAPNGNGPSQQLAQTQGNAYLMAKFPNLDYVVKATIAE